MKMKQKLKAAGPPLAVAVAHTPRGIAAAAKLSRSEMDLVEVRLDLLAQQTSLLRKYLPQVKPPVLLTARHPVEGGANVLSFAARRALLEEFLPFASAVDIEVRSIRGLSRVIEKAGERGVLKVFSFHDFRGVPSLEKLLRIEREARRAGADVVKIAAHLRGPSDFAVLLSLQAAVAGRALAVMGMGPLGCASRLALAATGSRLNYGFLDCPQVPGQWPAGRLRSLIAEVAV